MRSKLTPAISSRRDKDATRCRVIIRRQDNTHHVAMTVYGYTAEQMEAAVRTMVADDQAASVDATARRKVRRP